MSPFLLQPLTLPHAEKLDITEAPSNILYRFVSSSIELRELTLHGFPSIPHNSDPIPAFPPASLPALTSLRIFGTPEPLNYLHTPQLKSLSLGRALYQLVPLGEYLRNFINRSAPPLSTFRLSSVDVTDDDILWCLERLPDVEYFSISHCPVSDAIPRALAKPPSLERSTDWLLPRLTKIGFNINTLIRPSSVIELLASRKSVPSAPHITGCVEFRGKVSKSDYETIQSYGNFFVYLKEMSESTDGL